MWYNIARIFQLHKRKRKDNMKNTSSAVLAAMTLAVGVVCGYMIPRSSEVVAGSGEEPEPKTFTIPEVAEVAKPDADAVANADEQQPDAQEPEREEVSTQTFMGMDAKVFKNGKKAKLDPDMEKRLSETMDGLAKSLRPDSFKDASADVLADIDTSWMSPADLAIHNNLQSLIQRKAEAETEMMKNLFSRNKDGGSSGSFNTNFEERMQLGKEIQEAYQQERDLLLRRTSDLLGYSGEDSEVFVATINDIYKATTPQQNGHHLSVSLIAPVKGGEGDEGGGAVFGGSVRIGN